MTIDRHKVLWIPNTCSFVLFKDLASLSNVSTSSDLILKTQWSLGQVTPFIGSKAFDALKLWATIKTFGRSGIEKLIGGRLALTAQVQQAICARRILSCSTRRISTLVCLRTFPMLVNAQLLQQTNIFQQLTWKRSTTLTALSKPIPASRRTYKCHRPSGWAQVAGLHVRLLRRRRVSSRGIRF